MMEILEFLISNPISTTILAIIAIVGFYYTYKGVQKKKLKFVISDTELIDNKRSDISKLTVAYDNKNIDKLTVTKITFHNASVHAIVNKDIAPKAPLRIKADKSEILDVLILKGADTANAIKIEQSKSHEYCITFDYLNRHEGGILQVIHTGPINSISVSQTLIDGKIAVSKNPNRNNLKLIIDALLAIILSFLITLGVLFIEVLFRVPEVIYTLSLFIIFTGTLSIILYLQVKEFVPKNCRKNQ